MDLAVGARVRLHSRRHDSYIQPWRGRFKAGREGTIVNGPGRNIKGWMVEWDHRTTKYPHEWRLVHSAIDLIVIDDGACPHPARNGNHEDYMRPDGITVCRACGRTEQNKN